VLAAYYPTSSSSARRPRESKKGGKEGRKKEILLLSGGQDGNSSFEQNFSSKLRESTRSNSANCLCSSVLPAQKKKKVIYQPEPPLPPRWGENI
jgi:hypothetical protein